MFEIAKQEQKSQLLKIYIPVLINFLLDEKIDINPNQFKRKVHN